MKFELTVNEIRDCTVKQKMTRKGRDVKGELSASKSNKRMPQTKLKKYCLFKKIINN